MSKTDLGQLYAGIQNEVDSQLETFRALWAHGSDKELFRELCFCVCTPQTKAQRAWDAVNELADSGLIESGILSRTTHKALVSVLRGSGVRFHNHKAAYIEVNRRRFFPETRKKLACILNGTDIKKIRSDLTRQVMGWGLKEASHFLRNIGYGSELCILDRHILRQLVDYGVIETMPSTLTKKVYLEIEDTMARFALEEGVPLDALDLTLWFKATGEVFR